jgi:dCMP deaminase
MEVAWWDEDIYPENDDLKRQRCPVERLPDYWDMYYMNLAHGVSLATTCASRQVGTVLVSKTNRIISIGYNGSPPGVHLCQDIAAECPRRVLGYGSGEGLHLCPAVHGETSAIASAAMEGHSTNDGTLYCWCCMPCVSCTAVIISAGIRRVVYLAAETVYHELSSAMFKEADVELACYTKEDVMQWALQQARNHK